MEKENMDAAEKNAGGHQNGKKKWLIAVICIVVVLCVIAGTVYAVFHHYFSLLGRVDTTVSSGPTETIRPAGTTLPEEKEDEPSVAPASKEEIDSIEAELMQNLEKMESDSELYTTDAFNILLIGVDSRSDSMTGRSDSMILVSINKDTKEVTMTSFLRDIYLSIPGYDSNRLNASYALGGADLLVKTIKANFGISVDRCVVVNFYIVMDLVDAIGGIDLDVTADEIDVMNAYIKSHNNLLGNAAGTDILSKSNAGTIHVNGSQALAYARVRYIGTDFARTGRQRTIITKCLDRIKEMDFGEINELAEAFLPRVQTDLDEGDCAALLLMALNLPDYTFQSLTIPGEGTWNNANINGMSVLTINFSENSQAWYEMVNGK